MKTLRAGYFAGEMGWQLMRYQAIIRHKAKDYDNVTIGCEHQYQFLYEDFATDFVDFPHEIKTRNMWMTNGRVYPMENAIEPSRKLCMDKTIPQKFIHWGKRKDDCAFDILIHARSTNNMSTYYRNWPLKHWTDLAYSYRKLNIACIGTEKGAMCIPETIDLRGLELKQLADVMASSKMLLSPSSGPAHFASLCGLSHIVWSDKNTVGIMNNEDRLKKEWNPFKTEFAYISSWNPTVEQVCEKVEAWL